MALEALHQILASAWTLWAVLIFAVIVRWAWRPANRRRFDPARLELGPLEADYAAIMTTLDRSFA